MLYILPSATKNKEWAWKLLQYLGGRTKDGQYTQANRLATDAMLGSGYQSVMDSDLLKKGWAKWGDVPTDPRRLEARRRTSPTSCPPSPRSGTRAGATP